jgi:hypothetical protein
MGALDPVNIRILRRQVRVDHGHLHVRVPQPLADFVDADSRDHQLGGEGVPQEVQPGVGQAGLVVQAVDDQAHGVLVVQAVNLVREAGPVGFRDGFYTEVTLDSVSTTTSEFRFMCTRGFARPSRRPA